MVVCGIIACRSNPLNMSVGTVPILPLPLAFTVALLNKLKELLSGAAARFK